jgi:EAL domain-containing protein (putative c-di-GMP-specific phosphodiesterase class I)
MNDSVTAARMLTKLKSLGVGLAIDDFGTGYSSLAYLERFPVDIIKIDRSFIASLDRGRTHRAIVRAVIELAHVLGMTVIAEGVETETQANALRELGCDLAQGFLYARPMPARHIPDYLISAPRVDGDVRW